MDSYTSARPRHILVIDDVRTLVVGTVHARSSREGLALLDEEAWDQVWLDHDLGQRDDIWPVVDELIARAMDDRPRPAAVFVHSANPVGAARMVLALERWYPVTRVDAAWYLAPPTR